MLSQDTGCKKANEIPGGQGVHPYFPFVEALENVPIGHGARSVSYSVSLVGRFLNPEANKAETMACFTNLFMTVVSLTASASEPREFLAEKTNLPVLNVDRLVSSRI